jgi:putative NIF3 family GTP cyclohydrolase 1 type 2
MPSGNKAVPVRAVTAGEILDRLKKNVGVEWREPTVDTIKAGDPATPVTDIATTMMATYAVLERAAAAQCNLIITHEPTFYGHFDKTEDIAREKDAVLADKMALIRKHNMVVFRFHDYWHQRKPDGILVGMTRALGWEQFKDPQDARLFRIPRTTVGALAADLKKRMKIPTLRVVGDPNLPVTRAAFAAGFPGFDYQRKLLQRDDVEVLVMGEAHEWETIEYAADAVAQKKRKALIILGHIPSEQAGMEECARWMKGFVSEVPIQFIPTADPFWPPK